MTKIQKRPLIFIIFSSIIIVFSMTLAFFRFSNVFGRTWQSLKDIYSSLRSYIYVFTDGDSLRSTVMDIPKDFTSILPIEWELFKAKMKIWATTLFTKESIQLFLIHVGNVIEKVSRFLMPISLIVFCIGLAIYLIISSPLRVDKDIEKIRRNAEKKIQSTKNNRKAERIRKRADKRIAKLKNSYTQVGNVYHSKGLKRYMKFKAKVLDKIKFTIVKYCKFVFKWKKGLLLWLFLGVWAYNLNILTIGFEAVAWIIYFCSADFTSIKEFYTQIVKFVGDFTVIGVFFPPVVWSAIVWTLIEVIRRHLGKEKIKALHSKDKEILKEYSGAIFLTGLQRSGKTSTGAHMSSLQEEVFRDDMAKPEMMKISAHFPEFCWNVLDEFLRTHRFVLNKKEEIALFIERLKFCYEKEIPMNMRTIQYRILKCKYGYSKFNNYLFDYDYKKYGTKYNNGVRNVDIFEDLEAYAELYFVYDAPTSLIFGVIPVRTDFKRNTEGFFPKYDFNRFKGAKESERNTQFCHIYDFDSGRLGKVMDVKNRQKDGFELGIAFMPENGKERGNQNTNAGYKADSYEVNPKNDGFEDDDKMRGHIGNIHWLNFYRRIFDEQRSGSISADSVQLSTQFQIEGKKEKIAMPFYLLGKDLSEWWIKFASNRFVNLYYTGRQYTLYGYFVRSILSSISKYFDVILQKYGYDELQMKIIAGMDGEVVDPDGKYYSTYCITRNDLYRTDSIRMFYRSKILGASGGLNEFPTFKSLDMSVDEMKQIHSIFYTRIINRVEEQKQARL